jgi:hypothetical protein
MFVSENPLLLVVVSINNWDSVPESAHGLFIVLFVAGKMLTYMPNQSPCIFGERNLKAFNCRWIVRMIVKVKCDPLLTNS